MDGTLAMSFYEGFDPTAMNSFVIAQFPVTPGDYGSFTNTTGGFIDYQNNQTVVRFPN